MKFTDGVIVFAIVSVFELNDLFIPYLFKLFHYIIQIFLFISTH